MKKLSLLLIAGLVITSFNLTAQNKAASPAAGSWNLIGNIGISPSSNFLGTTDAKPLIFRTNNLEQMRIQKTGRVGIGTNDPSAKLNVVSADIVSLSTPGHLMLGNVAGYNMALDYNVIQARYNGTASGLYLNYYGGGAFIGQGGTLQVPSSGIINAYGVTSLYGVTGVNGISNASYALNVNANSSIAGINITDPVDNLVLYSSKTGVGTGLLVGKSNTGTATPTIEGYSSGSADGVDGYSSTGFGVYGSSSSSYGVYGYSSTNIGVYGVSSGDNNTNGYAGYFVSNNYRGIYAQSASGWYAGYFQGDVFTSGTYTPSDQKIKKNIKSFNNAMTIINLLQPKNYEFRNDDIYAKMNLPKGEHYGLIAQDVEKILPQLLKDASTTVNEEQITAKQITADGKEPAVSALAKPKTTEVNFKALNYTELIPIIIKGMQEQDALIQQQQQQIDALKQLVQTMASNQSSASKSSIPAGAYLMQNNPNPFNQSTKIRCNIPSSVKQAQLVIYSADGKAVKSFSLNNKGMNEVTLTAGSLQTGQYKYSLVVDGKQVDTKSMVLTN